MEFIFWTSKSCAMIDLSPEDSDLFELKSGRIYGEMGGLAALGGLAAPFLHTHQKKTVHPNFG